MAPHDDTRPHDRRRFARFALAVEIGVGDATGTTRDISASGIYFTTDAALTTGARVVIRVPGAHLQRESTLDVRCQGRVVRVDGSGDQRGVGVAFDDLRFELPGHA